MAYPHTWVNGSGQAIDAVALEEIEAEIDTKATLAALAALSDDVPQPLAATGSPGFDFTAARSGHVHPNTGLVQIISGVALIPGTTRLQVAGVADVLQIRSAADVELGSIDSTGSHLQLGVPADVPYKPTLSFSPVGHTIDLDVNASYGVLDPATTGGMARVGPGGFTVFTRRAGTTILDTRLRVLSSGVGGIESRTYLDLYNERGDGAANFLLRGMNSDLTGQILRVQDHGLIVGEFGFGVADPVANIDVYPSTTTRVGILVKGVASQSADRQQWENAAGAVALAVTGTLAVEMIEQTDPAAPAANKARLYSRDNGSGKTQVCVRFPTGAVQVLATEP